MQFLRLLLFLLAFLFVFSTNPPLSAEESKPNILFILTDDQGWTTLSCYGNPLMKTPHLDQLAAEGMRFTDAYAIPQCTPTRATLLTGTHTATNGMWHVIPWYGWPWARVEEPPFREQLLPEQCRLPHGLKQAGYVTGMAGKWHLTSNEHGAYTHLKAESGPLFGFDEVAPPGPGSQNTGDKWVDHLTDAACEFMEENRDRPWFYYLSHHTLHGVVSAPEDLIQKHLDQGAPEEGLGNATYLAAIEHLDHSIGRLMKKLDDLELSDNTIVVFLSDNGGFDTAYTNPKESLPVYRGEEPLPFRRYEFENNPLREGKGSLYEGGTRVPCIVRWPEKIEAGAVSETPIHVVDWYPTLLDAAGVELEESPAGESLVSVFQGESLPERPLYWYTPLYDTNWKLTPSAAIREGRWKLIHSFGDWFDDEAIYHKGAKTELFDLEEDLSETTDLSAEHPEIVDRLKRKLFKWIRNSGSIIPQKNLHLDPAKAFDKTRNKQPWNQNNPFEG
ncbi:Arylsulphatase [Planctomycetales bacterium 10988]|nr:Arylsulphatase [Planctomycetales bacterium 10988]